MYLVEFFKNHLFGKFGLLYVVALSLLIKLLSIAYMTEISVNSDGVLYLTAAQYFAEGDYANGLRLYPMPVYSLLVAFFYNVFHDWVFTGRIINAIAIVLINVPMYLITARLFHKEAAILACIAFSIAPIPNEYAMEIIRGPVFVLCFLSGIYLVVEAIFRERLLFFSTAVILITISLLFRIEGAAVLFILPLCMGIYCLFKKDNYIFFLKGISVWLLTIVVIASAAFFMDANLKQKNRFNQLKNEIISIGKTEPLENYNYIYNALKQQEKIIISARTGHVGTGLFFSFARHYIIPIYFLGLCVMLIKVVYPLFLIPCIAAVRHFKNPAILLILFVFFFYLLMNLYFCVRFDLMAKRFLFPAAALLFPIIGCGLYQLFSSENRILQRKPVKWILVLMFFISPIIVYAAEINEYDRAIVNAGRWFEREYADSNLKVIYNDTRLIFYAGRKPYFGIEVDKLKNGFAKNRQGDILTIINKHNASEIGMLAKNNDIGILILKLNYNNYKIYKKIENYRVIKEFAGKKDVVVVFKRLSL